MDIVRYRFSRNYSDNKFHKSYEQFNKTVKKHNGRIVSSVTISSYDCIRETIVVEFEQACDETITLILLEYGEFVCKKEDYSCQDDST